MGLIKKFVNFTGQASKLSPLLTQKNKLREATNMMVESAGNLIKRRGTSANGSDVGLGDGAVFFDEKQEALFIGDELYKRNGTGLTLIDNGKTGAINVTTTQAWGAGSLGQPSDTAEYAGNIYIAKEGDNLKRYDGNTITNAGMHDFFPNRIEWETPTIPAGGAGLTALPQFIVRTNSLDANGNTIVSADNETKAPTSFGSIIAGNDMIINIKPESFFGGGASWVSKYAVTPVCLNSADFSVTTTPGYEDLVWTSDSHNFVVGDWVYPRAQYTTLLDGSTIQTAFIGVEIVNVDGTGFTTRVFQPNSRVKNVTLSGSTPVHDTVLLILSNMYLEVFMTNSNGVYKGIAEVNAFIDTTLALSPNDEFIIDNSIQIKVHSTNIQRFNDTLAPNTFFLIQQSVGITLPPICKLVERHQGLLVLGNGSPYISQRSDALDLPLVNAISEDARTIYWSDTSGLSSIREMFAGVNNSLVIGVPEEGGLEALVSHNGILLAFLEKAVYQISGTLPINPRVDKLYGSGVGCVSRGSIQEIGTSIFFLSNKGIYSARGGSLPEEISTNIDDVFEDTGLDFTKAVSAHDIKRNQYILHIPHSTPADAVTVVYDYEFQGWFVWKEMDAAGGITIDDTDDEVYFVQADGAVKAMKDARNDESVAITSRVRTQHEDLDEPSLLKKFLNFKLFNLGGTGHVSTVKSYGDYSTTAETNVTMTTSATIPFEKIKFTGGKNKSHTMQVEVENAVVDEDMRIDGMEFEFEASSRRMKE